MLEMMKLIEYHSNYASFPKISQFQPSRIMDDIVKEKFFAGKIAVYAIIWEPCVSHPISRRTAHFSGETSTT